MTDPAQAACRDLYWRRKSRRRLGWRRTRCRRICQQRQRYGSMAAVWSSDAGEFGPNTFTVSTCLHRIIWWIWFPAILRDVGQFQRRLWGGVAYTSGAPGSGGDDILAAWVGDRVFVVEMAGRLCRRRSLSNPPNNGFTSAQLLRSPLFPPARFPSPISGISTARPAERPDQPDAGSRLGDHWSRRQLFGHRYQRRRRRDQQVARLSVIVPAAIATGNFNFSSVGGGILDSNNVGTALTTRLDGHRRGLAGSRSESVLNTSAGVLDITSTTCDFNGQVLMDSAEASRVSIVRYRVQRNSEFQRHGLVYQPADWYLRQL